MAELSNLVGALKVRQLGIKLARSNGFGLASQAAQGFQFARDDINKYAQHHQQAHTHNAHYGVTQAVKAAKNIALGANDSHRAACFAQRFKEHIAIFLVDHHAAHALFAFLHGMPQSRHSRVGVKHGLRKNGLAGNLSAVGMHKVGATTTYHNTVGVRIGLYR